MLIGAPGLVNQARGDNLGIPWN